MKLTVQYNLIHKLHYNYDSLFLFPNCTNVNLIGTMLALANACIVPIVPFLPHSYLAFISVDSHYTALHFCIIRI